MVFLTKKNQMSSIWFVSCIPFYIDEIDKSNDKKLQGEAFFINQIFDENIRRLHQGKKFFGKKMQLN